MALSTVPLSTNIAQLDALPDGVRVNTQPIGGQDASSGFEGFLQELFASWEVGRPIPETYLSSTKGDMTAETEFPDTESVEDAERSECHTGHITTSAFGKEGLEVCIMPAATDARPQQSAVSAANQAAGTNVDTPARIEIVGGEEVVPVSHSNGSGGSEERSPLTTAGTRVSAMHDGIDSRTADPGSTQTWPSLEDHSDHLSESGKMISSRTLCNTRSALPEPAQRHPVSSVPNEQVPVSEVCHEADDVRQQYYPNPPYESGEPQAPRRLLDLRQVHELRQLREFKQSQAIRQPDGLREPIEPQTPQRLQEPDSPCELHHLGVPPRRVGSDTLRSETSPFLPSKADSDQNGGVREHSQKIDTCPELIPSDTKGGMVWRADVKTAHLLSGKGIFSVNEANLMIPEGSMKVAANESLQSSHIVLETQMSGVEIPEQLAEGARWLVRNGKTEAELQLNPPELGRIKLSLRVTEGTVRGVIEVADPSVKALIQAELPRLSAALAERGLELTQFDVLLRDGNQSRRERESVPRQPLIAGSTEDDTSGSSASPVAPVANSSGLIDYFM